MTKTDLRHTILVAAMATAIAATASVPLVYDRENTGAPARIDLFGLDALPAVYTLPDALTMVDGSPVETLDDWSRRRNEIITQLYHYEIGAKPATPRDSITARMDADTLLVTVRNNGEALTIKAPIIYPEGDGPFPAIIGIGWPSGSLPHEIFTDRGIAMIAFNFNDVTSHTQTRGAEPINRLYPDMVEIGSYAAWPWGVSRLLDGLEILGNQSRIDMKHIGITGCSFAGKMALFSGALDERIALTIAQEPGGGGVAAWRVSETLGNVETLGRTNYSWFKESMRQFSEDNVCRLPVDHNELTALIAPRALLVLGNPDYEWLADESGYVSSVVARKVWKHFGVPERMGYSIVAEHMHCQLPEVQYPEVEAFVDAYLLGKPGIDTNVTRADMFKGVNVDRWMPKR